MNLWGTTTEVERFGVYHDACNCKPPKRWKLGYNTTVSIFHPTDECEVEAKEKDNGNVKKRELKDCY